MTLTPDQTLEREMTGAETHRYKFDLKENEFFQVQVEQKGVDVALKLIDASGATLATMDSPNGKEGFETLSFVADKAGSFVLEAAGFDKKAEKGNYNLNRQTSRPATAQDRRRVEVEHLFVEALTDVQGITDQNFNEQIETVISKFQVVLNGWEEVKDNYLTELTAQQFKQLQDVKKKAKAKEIFIEALTFVNQGTKESKQSALLKFEEARKIYQEIIDKQSEAYCLTFSGNMYSDLGEKQKALEFYNQSLPLAKIIDDKSLEATTLSNIGKIYSDLGENQKALDYFNQSLPLTRTVGDKSLEATTLINIGKVYDDLGEKQKALEYYKQALPILRDVRDESKEAVTLNNIGKVYSDLGEQQKALDYFNKALPLARVVGNKSQEALTLNNIGAVYAALGERQKALEYINQALPLFRIIGDKNGEALTLNNISNIYDDLGEKQKALEYLNQALPLFRIVGDKSREAVTLINIGTVYFGLGEKQKALDYYNQSLTLARAIGDKSREAVTLNNIGTVYSDLGEKQKALNYYNQSLPLARAIGDKSGEARTLNNIMSVWESLKNSRVAAFYGKQSVNKFQELRQNIKGLDKEIQKTYLKSVESTYRKLADLLIQDGRFAQAEKVLAMLKEEEYFDFVRRDASEIGKLDERVPLNEKEKALIARYSQLADKITEIGQEFIKLDDKKRTLSRNDLSLSAEDQKRYDELEKQLDVANAAFQLFLTKELVAEIGKEKTGEIEIDRNLQDKLRKWGEGTVALYTVAGADRYRVILTTPKIQVDGKTEIKIADLNKKVFAFRAALQNPNIDPRPLGKELYDILIKPVEKELKAANAKTLVWSLDGTLRYIPLAALSPDGKRYLVEDVQNVIITPKTRDDVSDSNANWQALGLGVSDAQTIVSPEDKTRKIPFNPLPGTERELLAIVKDEKSPNETGVLIGRRFMNKDFTTTNFKDSLAKETEDGKRKYNVVHIASHFSLGSNWSNSFLLLGNGEILTLEEINNSSTISFGDVELITLSACNTGFADDTNGKEIDSLASVIQTKSGKAVLATLWAVADESTSLLMSEFYRLRKENPKLTKAKAMQMAQKAMIEGKLKSENAGNLKGAEIIGDTNNKVNALPFQVDKDKPFAHPFYWSPFILIGNWR